MSVTVFEHPLSPYAQSVKIALREKNITFSAITPDGIGGQTPQSFISINPRSEVPAFIHGNVQIFETPIILSYINDIWPSKDFYPSDPARNATSSLAANVALTQYEALMWAMGEIRIFKRAEGQVADKLVANIQNIATEIQGFLAEKLGEGKFFAGDEFGYADICIAPMIESSIRNKLGPERGVVREWFERVKERESVKTTFEEARVGLKHLLSLGSKRPSGFKREYRDHRLDLMIRIGGIQVVVDGLKKDNIRFSWPDVLREKL